MPENVLHIYLIPGHGNDGRLFYRLHWPPEYRVRVLTMYEPLQGEDITAYALRLCRQVDAGKPFILIGVSLGGILCVEMAKHIVPVHIILISSIKTRFELPTYMKFWSGIRKFEDLFHKKDFPFTATMPLGLKYLKMKPVATRRWYLRMIRRLFFMHVTWDEFMVYAAMMGDASVKFMSWAEIQIVGWKNEVQYTNITHIHGLKDRTFPVKYIKKFIPVTGGDHCMVVHKGEEINRLIHEVLDSLQ